jgi:hypothetical protein
MTAPRLRTVLSAALCASISMEPVALAQGAPPQSAASQSAPPQSAPSSPPGSEKADPAAPPAQQDSDFAAKKKEAQAAFERGLTHYEKEEWDPALVEFTRSRAAYPTRSATKNAALCLRKLGRLDEAIDMFEALLGFENLPEDDRKATQTAITELGRTLGTLRIEGALAGASIVVDGRFRGTAPLPAPLRVTEGSHEVRAFKEGQDPFGATADVTPHQETKVTVRSLSTGGRLRVTEERGRVLDVVVDGGVVGKTPWEGPLSVGPHVVLLRGHGQWVPDCASAPAGESPERRAAKEVVELGTVPAKVRIRLHELTSLTLAAEELDTSLRIEPKPAGAPVEIDSAFVGWGTWEGMLRVGEHRVVVSAEGFTPVTRVVAPAAGDHGRSPAAPRAAGDAGLAAERVRGRRVRPGRGGARRAHRRLDPRRGQEQRAG